MMFGNLICFFSPAVQCRQLQIRHNISRHTEFKKTDSDSLRLVKNGSTRHCNLWTNNLPVLLQRRRNLFSLFLSTTGNDISKSFFPVSRCIYGLRRGGSETHIEPHSRAALFVCHHSRVHREIGNDAVFRAHRRSFARQTSADLI